VRETTGTAGEDKEKGFGINKFFMHFNSYMSCAEIFWVDG
jgi:hypothetical protein